MLCAPYYRCNSCRKGIFWPRRSSHFPWWGSLHRKWDVAPSVFRHRCRSTQLLSYWRCRSSLSWLVHIHEPALIEEKWFLSHWQFLHDLLSFVAAPSSLSALFQCQSGAVRLADGLVAGQGRVEVCANGVWGPVCNRGWGENEALVVCKQLGFYDGRSEL